MEPQKTETPRASARSKRQHSRRLESTIRDSGNSLDFTYNSIKQQWVRKKSKDGTERTTRGGHSVNTGERGVLLDEETIDYDLYHNTSDSKSENSSEVSFAQNLLETGRNKRYHRCFKINLCLNISMLITFMGLIIFGKWYYMRYEDDEQKLSADFTLMILETTSLQKSTGQQQFKRYWAMSFP